ncbi:hypothetical protein P3W53_07100 [Pseudomonas denitrificans (nom. rej.)]|nr:hypothetical protein [Pseudomonas denitrificans (nom. rej.)]
MKLIPLFCLCLLTIPPASAPVTAEELEPETLSELTDMYLRGELRSLQPIWRLENRNFEMRDRKWKDKDRPQIVDIKTSNRAAPIFHKASYIENYGADTSSAPKEHTPLISLDREETLLKIIEDQNSLIETLSNKIQDLEKQLNERH